MPAIETVPAAVAVPAANAVDPVLFCRERCKASNQVDYVLNMHIFGGTFNCRLPKCYQQNVTITMSLSQRHRQNVLFKMSPSLINVSYVTLPKQIILAMGCQTESVIFP
jgi:hypothetical protein